MALLLWNGGENGRVFRGGSWVVSKNFVGQGEAAGRAGGDPAGRNDEIGFRCCRTLDADADTDHDFDADATDCAPADATVHHGATETCNGNDDDCNGTADEGGDALCLPGEACQGAAGCVAVGPTCPSGTEMVDNGDGTVTDPATCFVWQKTPPEDRAYSDAVAYCQNNPDGLPGAGWHLPNISELRSLIRGCPATATGGICGVVDICPNCGVSSPCLSPSCSSTSCTGCPTGYYIDGHLDCNYSDWFWSSSPMGGSAYYSWIIRFDNGGLSYGGLIGGGIRCLRSGP